ncbi:hypothetical protein OG216_01815 [Streptomycetaceae bacterium NBC_01309]
MTVRQLANPVSRPRLNAELPVSAWSVASQGRRWLTTATAVSRSATPTWTWSPHAAYSSTTPR